MCFNEESKRRIANIEINARCSPTYSRYDIRSYVYDIHFGCHAIVVLNGEMTVNLFLFFPDANGDIGSISIYGSHLRGHLNAILSTMTVFGMKVESAEMDCSGVSDFVDIQLADKSREDTFVEGLQPFSFNSTSHQRYEHGEPVMGLQYCCRTVSVERNVNGCPGYRLSPGDGYIVKLFNDDIGRPNMSDKPMRLVSATPERADLRGFPIEAQTPFGWQLVDYRDYGLSVYYDDDNVSRCVLHLFDRDVDICYM